MAYAGELKDVFKLGYFSKFSLAVSVRTSQIKQILFYCRNFERYMFVGNKYLEPIGIQFLKQ